MTPTLMGADSPPGSDIGRGDGLLRRSCRNEAYSLHGRFRPRKCLVPGRPDGDQGAGPIGRAAEGAEDVAGLVVDARAGDPAQPLRQLDRLEGSRRRREEATGAGREPRGSLAR